ncbi:MAG: S8 family serine peptidase, partial [Promethearchaeota archaeon]
MKGILKKKTSLQVTILLLILTIPLLLIPRSNLPIFPQNQTSNSDTQEILQNNPESHSIQATEDLIRDESNPIINPSHLVGEEEVNSHENLLTLNTASGETFEVPIPNGINAIQSFSVKGDTTLFINDQRGGEKIEILLKDYSFLWEEGYINEGKIRVIVLPGSSIQRNLYAIQPLSYEKISLYSQKLQAFGGTIVSTARSFPFLTVELPYEEVFAIAEQEYIAHVFLDKKVSIRLNQSVPIIKSPPTWSQLETQVGFEINGSGVRIAILDTGIDSSHPDLDDLDDEPATFDPKVIAEAGFTDENRTSDGHGHGTHCASTAAGTGEASNYNYVGVAPAAYLLNGKVLTDDGWGFNSWIIEGIEWAVNQSADIISMSLGQDLNGDGTDPLSLAVDWAADQGVVSVVAAGNIGSLGMYSVGIPADARKAITVGATTKSDEISDFSSQ